MYCHSDSPLALEEAFGSVLEPRKSGWEEGAQVLDFLGATPISKHRVREKGYMA